MHSWYLIRNGKKLGPFTTEWVTRAAKMGQIHPEDYLQRDDWEQPKPAAQVVRRRGAQRRKQDKNARLGAVRNIAGKPVSDVTSSTATFEEIPPLPAGVQAVAGGRRRVLTSPSIRRSLLISAGGVAAAGFLAVAWYVGSSNNPASSAAVERAGAKTGELDRRRQHEAQPLNGDEGLPSPHVSSRPRRQELPVSWEDLLDSYSGHPNSTSVTQIVYRGQKRVEVRGSSVFSGLKTAVQPYGDGYLVVFGEMIYAAGFFGRWWFTPSEGDRMIDLYVDYVSEGKQGASAPVNVGRYSVQFRRDVRFDTFPAVVLEPAK